MNDRFMEIGIRVLCGMLTIIFLRMIIFHRRKNTGPYGYDGPDLIEYALMACLIAVFAGAIMPGVASSISAIFAKVDAALRVATTNGVR